VLQIVQVSRTGRTLELKQTMQTRSIAAPNPDDINALLIERWPNANRSYCGDPAFSVTTSSESNE